MDVAYLHHSLINIEQKRKELEEQLSREETRNFLEDKYRILSKKGAFTCVRCNKPVNMNLTKDAGRPFYFKHIDGSGCAFSENTRTYQQHNKKMENLPKKELGIAVFKEILEGELKPFKAVVERGYHYKTKLRFVPDFIVSFPELKNKWAIDYFTAMDRKVVSGHYARQLTRRMKTYQKEGFKAYAFVDSDWLALREETRMGTLFNSEVEVASKGREDHLWDQFLNQRLQGALLDFFKQYIGANTVNFDTKSIAYVDLNDRSCQVIRWIPVSRNYRNLTFYQLTSSQASLSSALSINAKYTGFQLSALNEDNKRAGFLAELIEKKAERDRAIKGEKERHFNTVSLPRAPQAESQTQPVIVDITDEEVETIMRERAKSASMRPVQYSDKRLAPLQVQRLFAHLLKRTGASSNKKNGFKRVFTLSNFQGIRLPLTVRT